MHRSHRLPSSDHLTFNDDYYTQYNGCDGWIPKIQRIDLVSSQFDVSGTFWAYNSLQQKANNALQPRDTLKGRLFASRWLCKESPHSCDYHPFNSIKPDFPTMQPMIVPQSVYINTKTWPIQKQRCRFFMRGHCNKGHHCLYQHSHHRKSPSLSSEDSTRSSRDSIDTPPSSPTHSMKFSTPVAQKVVRRPNEIQCWYFLYDHCKFGDRCVNAHTGPIHRRPIYPALPRLTSPISAPIPTSPTSSTRSSLLPELELLVLRSTAAAAGMRQEKPQKVEVITIDEALELDIDDEYRMMAYLDRDLREFIEGVSAY